MRSPLESCCEGMADDSVRARLQGHDASVCSGGGGGSSGEFLRGEDSSFKFNAGQELLPRIDERAQPLGHRVY